VGTIKLTREGNVAVITIASEGKLNAFTREMRLNIVGHANAIAKDPAALGAVITGAGDAFCAGQDLTESVHWDSQVPWVEEFETLMRSIWSLPKPVVAAVNGVAAGGGFQLALLCDSRVGCPETRMGQPEVRTGLASVTGTWLMQRAVGELRARELALSGRLMEIDELVRLNFIDEVATPGTVLGAAIARCRMFAANPADSFARTKLWMYEHLSSELAQVVVDAVEKHRLGFAAGVSQAGAAGFIAGSAAA
jgi:enoyl-CoA hydratase/carnithine racemase